SAGWRTRLSSMTVRGLFARGGSTPALHQPFRLLCGLERTQFRRRIAVLEVAVIETPSLGDRSYLATDGSVALASDPHRDIDRVIALAQRQGAGITHVFETHIHNDYVTGGLALAREVGADYHVNGADDVSFERVKIADGDRIKVGEMQLRVIATPGHTF